MAEAKVNREALQALQKRSKNGSGPGGLSVMEYGPSVKVLSGRRNLGTIDQILETVGRFDPNRITMRQRHQMRRDPMIAMGLHFIGVPIVNADYHFECDDERVAQFVDRAYRAIHQRLLMGMLTSLPYGYAAIVKRYQLEAPKWTYEPKDEPGKPKPVWPEKTLQAVTWNDPQVLPPEGAEPMFAADGRTFTGIKHLNLVRQDGDQQALEVPATHALWVTNEREASFGDWYGYPRTGYALRMWWSYWYRWLLGDRHFEQDADPPLVVRAPEALVPDPDHPGHGIEGVDLGIVLGNHLKSGSVISVPSTTYRDADEKPTSTPLWSFEFLKGGENMAAFQQSFEYLDVMKLRSLLVPEQALIEGKGGTSSRNVAATYGAAFAESEGILANEFDQLVNDYLIPDLVAQNFVDAPPCLKVTTGFRDDDLALVNEIIQILTQNDPSSLHLDVREMVRSVGLPQLAADEAPQIQGKQPPIQLPPGADAGQQPGQPAGGQSGVTIDGQSLAADLPDDWRDLLLGDPGAADLVSEVLDLQAAWREHA